jgi:para-aminobenzoate synthetase component 1
MQPEDAFRKIANRDGCFFLDSALFNPRFGRYSFLGVEPVLTLQADGDLITLRGDEGEKHFRSNPFEALRQVIRSYAPLFERFSFGPPFVGGLVGYLGYDLRHFIERLPASGRRDQRFPDMYFGLYPSVLCWDAVEKQWIIANTETGAESNADEILREALAGAKPSAGENAPSKPAEAPVPSSNFTKAEYLRAVQRVKDYIAAGDIFQANLSQRFETKCTLSPAKLHARLRRDNPAPFAAFIRLDDERCVMSSSPERFLRVTGRGVETRPIKGTRPRHTDPGTDEKMKSELLASEKDAAELAMIVDLERNDLGRVCEFGSVRVTEPRILETYATVHHLVATVVGRLRSDANIVSLLEASFPGGSITGAPKIRAMEIIDMLEPTARSVYTGSIGYIGFGGYADINIAIRTLLLDGERVTFQVGGGIVADSDPQLEFEETIHKAGGIMKALRLSPPR